MREQKYLDDIQEIKTMMSRSTRFISLSGLSGISAGTVALLGGYLVYRRFLEIGASNGLEPTVNSVELVKTISLTGLVTLVLAGVLAWFFTYRRAQGQRLRLWSPYSRRVLINLCVPLAIGGYITGLMLLRGGVTYVAPLTLIFYGLALVNASHYTLNEIRTMGYTQLLIGTVSFWFLDYGLLFWMLGFGLVHIAYGIYMYNKYER